MTESHRNGAAYLASVWALVFAAMSFYWAAGGTGGLKVLGAALALALVWPWGRSIPRRMLLVGSWAVGLLVVAYAMANFVQHGLMEAGVVNTPDGLGSTAVTWHLAFWDPFWLLGGALFSAAAWRYWRTSSRSQRR